MAVPTEEPVAGQSAIALRVVGALMVSADVETARRLLGLDPEEPAPPSASRRPAPVLRLVRQPRTQHGPGADPPVQ